MSLNEIRRTIIKSVNEFNADCDDDAIRNDTTMNINIAAYPRKGKPFKTFASVECFDEINSPKSLSDRAMEQMANELVNPKGSDFEVDIAVTFLPYRSYTYSFEL